MERITWAAGTPRLQLATGHGWVWFQSQPPQHASLRHGSHLAAMAARASCEEETLYCVQRNFGHMYAIGWIAGSVVEQGKNLRESLSGEKTSALEWRTSAAACCSRLWQLQRGLVIEISFFCIIRKIIIAP